MFDRTIKTGTRREKGDGSRGGERSRLSRAGNEDDKREEEEEDAAMRRGVGQRSSCDMEAVGSEEVWVEVLEMSEEEEEEEEAG